MSEPEATAAAKYEKRFSEGVLDATTGLPLRT
jgi:hypothetical protein